MQTCNLRCPMRPRNPLTTEHCRRGGEHDSHGHGLLLAARRCSTCNVQACPRYCNKRSMFAALAIRSGIREHCAGGEGTRGSCLSCRVEGRGAARRGRQSLGKEEGGGRDAGKRTHLAPGTLSLPNQSSPACPSCPPVLPLWCAGKPPPPSHTHSSIITTSSPSA